VFVKFRSCVLCKWHARELRHEHQQRASLNPVTSGPCASMTQVVPRASMTRPGPVPGVKHGICHLGRGPGRTSFPSAFRVHGSDSVIQLQCWTWPVVLTRVPLLTQLWVPWVLTQLWVTQWVPGGRSAL
jgi:hypothetical protein